MQLTTRMEGVQKQFIQKQKVIPQTQEEVELGVTKTIPIGMYPASQPASSVDTTSQLLQLFNIMLTKQEEGI